MIATPVALLVLLSALLHASWNVIVKSSRDALADTVGMALGAGVLAALTMPFLPGPAPESWPWLAASVCIHTLYFTGVVEAYRWAELSAAYPMMRGTAPVLVSLFATVLGEPPTPLLALGIALISLGIVAPSWLAARAAKLSRRGVGVALGNSVLIAAYTLTDGVGARLAADPLTYAQWLFSLLGLCLPALALWRRGTGLLSVVSLRWRSALAGALLTLGSYVIALWAMTRAPVAAVAALRETSVVFAALMGALLLRESLGAWRIGGAILVGLGAVMVRMHGA